MLPQPLPDQSPSPRINAPDGRPLRLHVQILDRGQVVICSQGESVLAASSRTGSRLLPVGCRGGGCGVCKIEVLRGTYTQKAMSESQICDADRAGNRVLACCVFPTEDMTIRIIGKQGGRRVTNADATGTARG